MTLPKWWCDNITVFRKTLNNYDEVVWTKYEFKNCFYSKSSYEKIKGGDLYKDVETVVRIPYEDNKKIIKQMVLVKEDDIVFKGKTNEVLDEYGSGITANEFISKHKYEGCIKVTEFSDNTCIGRPNLHLLIRGK